MHIMVGWYFFIRDRAWGRHFRGLGVPKRAAAKPPKR
jgi:hypothetical protein